MRLSIAGMFALSPDVRAEAGRQALALAGVPELMRARHLARLVHNLLVAGRPGEARELLGEAKAVVHASGDAAAAFTLELAEAGLGYVAGRFAASLPLVESAVRHGADANDPARHRFAQEWRGEWLAALDRLNESLEASAEGLHSAQRDRQAWAVRLLEAWRGRQLLQLGRLSDAAAVLEGPLRSRRGARRRGRPGCGRAGGVGPSGDPHRRSPAAPPSRRDRRGGHRWQYAGGPPPRRLATRAAGYGQRGPLGRAGPSLYLR